MPEAEYVALRRMKVHEVDENGENKLDENGRAILRELAAGDPIPEAPTWRNLYKEIRAGRVGLAGTGFGGPALADSLKRSPLPGHKPRPRKRGRRRAGGAMSAGEVAVANATGRKVRDPVEGAPKGVSREGDDLEE